MASMNHIYRSHTVGEVRASLRGLSSLALWAEAIDSFQFLEDVKSYKAVAVSNEC